MNQVKIVPSVTAEEFGMTPKEDTSLLSVDSARAVAQIQCAMTIAKKFPRDENAALNRIMQAAKRRKVAEKAEYEYSKGGTSAAGPSIRAAEVVAQSWGNMISGVTEVVRDGDKKESLMLAYSADMETNNWKFLEWRVPHTQDRSAAKGGAKALESGRDIYERIMNDGSRRLRNCILAVIPGDVMETFIEECNKTLDSNEIPIKTRLGEMHKAMTDIGVTQPMIENKMGCSFGAITERQLSQLRRIYQSIKDGFGKVPDYFQVAAEDQKTKTDQLKAALDAAPVKIKQTVNQPHKDIEDQGDFSAFQSGIIENPSLVEEPEPEFNAPEADPDLVKDHHTLVLEVISAADKHKIPITEIAASCKKSYGVEPRELTKDQLILVRNYYLNLKPAAAKVVPKKGAAK